MIFYPIYIHKYRTSYISDMEYIKDSNETIQRVLEAMDKMGIEPRYSQTSGFYFFSHKIVDMFLPTNLGAGEVCLGAEFVIPFDSFTPLLEPLCDSLNNMYGGFVAREVCSGVGFVAKVWLIDYEEPLSEVELSKMLDEVIMAYEFMASNLIFPYS